MRVTTSCALALSAAGSVVAQSTNYTSSNNTALNSTASNSTATDLTAVAANLEHYWSYGRVPPVYPSPQGAGLGDWAFAYARAKALVQQLTNEEKNNLTFGITSTTNGCSGNIPAIDRVGFPGICLNDAGNGVRGTDGVNGYPSGLHSGASWNADLNYRRAQSMGAEFRRKGVAVALGPVVGPLGKIAEGGRNWEGFANDPYLAGSLASEAVRGLQENVIACIKHFIGNEQETNRNPPILGAAINVSISTNIDDKTIHELYLWPFQDAVHAGVGAAMCSYNQLNGSYACQNSKSLNGLLKEELGFQGFIVSDWLAQHAGLASAEAGLDMAMPSSPLWGNGLLATMVSNGSLPQSRLDDMATRILAAWYKFSELGNPGHGLPLNLLAAHEFVDARVPTSEEIIFQSAVEGHVLVKNVNNALPLKKPRVLSLFGYDAVAYTQNSPTAGTLPKWSLGLENTLAITGLGAFNDSYLLELFLSSAPSGSPVPDVALNGTVISGGGSGATQPSYVDAPFDAFQRQARKDGTFLTWDFQNQNVTVLGSSEACIVFINAQASEGVDRPDLSDSYSDTLVQSVASQCNNTIVSIHNAGIRIVDAWVDHPNVTAVIYAHLPGQDSGAALVEVMYGNQSPSGRLPYTVAHNASDYGILRSPTVPDNTTLYHTQDNFTEGVYIDYKHFIAQNITPRYEFGYGLTYSDFSYSNLATFSISSNGSLPAYPDKSVVAEGGSPDLWATIAEVTARVSNTGSVDAAEVAQLYIGIPGGPAKQLRGYSKQMIQAGQYADVSFKLTRRDLSSWNVDAQSWELQSGSYPVYVGKSVLDDSLTGTLSI